MLNYVQVFENLHNIKLLTYIPVNGSYIAVYYITDFAIVYNFQSIITLYYLVHIIYWLKIEIIGFQSFFSEDFQHYFDQNWHHSAPPRCRSIRNFPSNSLGVTMFLFSEI